MRQGSVLSPLLFAIFIYLDDLAALCRPECKLFLIVRSGPRPHGTPFPLLTGHRRRTQLPVSRMHEAGFACRAEPTSQYTGRLAVIHSTVITSDSLLRCAATAAPLRVSSFFMFLPPSPLLFYFLVTLL